MEEKRALAQDIPLEPALLVNLRSIVLMRGTVFRVQTRPVTTLLIGVGKGLACHWKKQGVHDAGRELLQIYEAKKKVLSLCLVGRALFCVCFFGGGFSA